MTRGSPPPILGDIRNEKGSGISNAMKHQARSTLQSDFLKASDQQKKSMLSQEIWATKEPFPGSDARVITLLHLAMQDKNAQIRQQALGLAQHAIKTYPRRENDIKSILEQSVNDFDPKIQAAALALLAPPESHTENSLNY